VDKKSERSKPKISVIRVIRVIRGPKKVSEANQKISVIHAILKKNYPRISPITRIKKK